MSIQQVMAKGHWEDYPFKIEMLAAKPKNCAPLTQDDAHELHGELLTDEHGTISTGMWIRFYWIVDRTQKRVVSCRYLVFGEPALRAAAEMASLLCRDKIFEEIENINYKSLEYFLRDRPGEPALPQQKRYVVFFILEAIDAMLRYAKEGGRPENGTNPVICECSGVRKKSIEYAIKKFDLSTTEDITDMTRAGAFCGRCVTSERGRERRAYYLADILKEIRKSMKKKASTQSGISDKPFKEMDLHEKRLAIAAVIDDHIRAMLVMDGGDMEILDVKENGEHTDIYIRYLGACSGCASASTGTLFAIEGILKQKLHPDIRVLPL
jgi:NifU-like protein